MTFDEQSPNPRAPSHPRLASRLTIPSWFALCLLLASCAPSRAAQFPSDLELRGGDGEIHDLSAEVAAAELSVFVFFAEDCPCMAAHEPRLKAWSETFKSAGVRFFLVDAEAGASPARSARTAAERSYSFPVLADPEARLARSLGVEFATHTVVLDRAGQVRYSGAIDSDKVVLHEDADLYLKEVLEDLLAGRLPRRAHTEPMGCVLELS